MAITAIWPVKDRLKRVIGYAANKEKTEMEKNDLMKALSYISHDAKTEEKRYITGVNCTLSTAFDEMMTTKKQYGKTNSIQAFHAIQAFMPGEVTPQQAHEIGVKLAERLWGQRFEVIVATHVDRAHIHSHFVINSVSFKDGKRYYDNKKTYHELKDCSDMLCREYGLSVITEPKGKKVPYAVYTNQVKDKDLIIQDVELALGQSLTKKEFLKRLESLGYSIKQGKHLAIKPAWSQRYRRLYKLNGDMYSDENISERLLNNHYAKSMTVSYARPDYHGHLQKKKLKGFKAYYFKMMYLFGILPAGNPRKPHPSMKKELMYLEEISREATFIGRNGIETLEDLESYMEPRKTWLAMLREERRKLYKPIENCKDPEEKRKLEKAEAEMTEVIQILRKEMELCKNIKDRSLRMQPVIKNLEEEERKKGAIQNERRR